MPPNKKEKKSKKRKTRSDTRKVIEALYYTMQYRGNYYGTFGNSPMLLEDAAANLPILKKTLDDYFLHLKIAYLTGFNFDDLQNISMSDIRAHNK
jgi:hypothetical protein